LGGTQGGGLGGEVKGAVGKGRGGREAPRGRGYRLVGRGEDASGGEEVEKGGVRGPYCGQIAEGYAASSLTTMGGGAARWQWKGEHRRPGRQGHARMGRAFRASTVDPIPMPARCPRGREGTQKGTRSVGNWTRWWVPPPGMRGEEARMKCADACRHVELFISGRIWTGQRVHCRQAANDDRGCRRLYGRVWGLWVYATCGRVVLPRRRSFDRAGHLRTHTI
jgi:hypothetical protein